MNTISLVALLCHLVGGLSLCHEQIIADSDNVPALTAAKCLIGAQSGIAQWMQVNNKADWTVGGYQCVQGHYVLKDQA